MTTSGTYTFNYTRDQIINSAARKIGAIASGEALSASAIQDFSDALNILVKALNATGLHIWTEEEAILFLQPNQINYTIGGSTTDNCTDATKFTATTLSAAAATSVTTVSVTATSTGFSNGVFVGVVLDSGSIFWSTEIGNPVGGVVTLAAGLTGTAAAGNAVYAYASQIQRPLRVVSSRRFNFPSAIDTPMIQYSRIDYRNLPNKLTSGIPTIDFYDPRGGAFNQGIMSVWPSPPDATNAIKFTWWRLLQDFNSPGNNPDLPVEWIQALIWNLAAQMAIEYDIPPQRYQMITQMAQGSLELVSGWDREPESYMFGFNADQTSVP